jgi:hypothetical protein
VVDPRLPVEIYVDQIQKYLHYARPDLRFEQLQYRGTIQRSEGGILPTALPYRTLSSAGT